MTRNRILFIGALLAGLAVALYITQLDREDEFFYHLDVLFQSLFFIPVVLAGLWFGLRGGLLTALAVIIIMAPYLVLHWEGLSATDLNLILQKVTYLIVAFVLGKAIERQRREQALAREAESLAAVGRSMAAVTHNLKTPLASIGGFSRMIRGRPDDTDARRYLDVVVSEVERMEAMVGDLAAFSKPLRLDMADQDVGAVIQDVLRVAGEAARNKKVRLRGDIPAGLPAAHFDAGRIKEVLLNLVINAIDASPEGEPVEVRATARGRRLILEVSDCGCGIPPDRRDEVFLPFRSTKKEGVGLGLVTAKKIVEAHGGTIAIVDNPDRGLTFRVILPDALAR